MPNYLVWHQRGVV
jgi:hypothetical protein